MEKLKFNKDLLIRDMLEQIKTNSNPLYELLCKKYSISRQTVYNTLQGLIKNKIVVKEQNKNQYSLKTVKWNKTYTIGKVEEHQALNDVLPMVQLPYDAEQAYSYIFSEMFNNAIEHSEGKSIKVIFLKNALSVFTAIIDDGIGIFNKIAQRLKLDNKEQSILELAKGKFTTDPKSHTGEGIFFSSKIANSYFIESDRILFITKKELEENYLFPDQKDVITKGTVVAFVIDSLKYNICKDIFDKFTTDPEEYGFDKTVVPINLMLHGNPTENLISRSQARRLLVRFEKFSHIILDFEGVNSIGQAFADEIFRVFKNEHPTIILEAINADAEVKKMINRAINSNIND